MARLTAATRRALPKSAFAIPSKAPGPGSYPIPDAAHAAVAKGRAKEFASPAQRKAVMAKIHAKFPQMGSDSHPGLAYRHSTHSTHPGLTLKHGDHPSTHPGLRYK